MLCRCNKGRTLVRRDGVETLPHFPDVPSAGRLSPLSLQNKKEQSPVDSFLFFLNTLR